MCKGVLGMCVRGSYVCVSGYVCKGVLSVGEYVCKGGPVCWWVFV